MKRRTASAGFFSQIWDNEYVYKGKVGNIFWNFINQYVYNLDKVVHTVLRYGINETSVDVITSIIQHNTNFTPLPNSSAASKKPEDILIKLLQEKKGQLTQYEKNNVAKAILKLKQLGKDGDSVLVDVFVRDANGKIIDSNKQPISSSSHPTPPEIHTVVLLLENSKYLVIDPSNPTFSQVLVDADTDIRVCTSRDKGQIYTPIKTTGAKHDEARDCIDIAVKLAFRFKANAECAIIDDHISVKEHGFHNGCNIGEITYESLRSNMSVKETTNNNALYPKLSSELMKSNVIRLKQTSDVKEGKIITTHLKCVTQISTAWGDKMAKADSYHQNKYECISLNKIGTSSNLAEFIGNCELYYNAHKELVDCTEALGMLGSELNAIDQHF